MSLQPATEAGFFMPAKPTDLELQRRAMLARRAIRAGMDPLLALLLVIAPPQTAAEARDLVKQRAA